MNVATARPASSAADAVKIRTGPILLAVSGAPDSAAAVRAAADLVRSNGADLHVVLSWMPMNTAFGPAGQPQIDVEVAYEQPAAEALRAQAAELRADGVQVAGEHLLMGLAGEEIAELAKTIGARLVVTGSRGLGSIKRLILGSVSQRVVNVSTAPVLVVRNGDHTWPPERVLVACDGSESSRAAAAAGSAVARATGAAVTLVNVVTPDILTATLPGEASKAGEAMMRALAHELTETYGVSPKTEVVVGDTAETLLAMAATSYPTLLALGSRGHGAFRRIALGSVSMAVLHRAEGPVLIAHALSPAPNHLGRTAHEDKVSAPGALAVTTAMPPPVGAVYLTECASCGGQFPSFRAICAECEDVADEDGYRDGRRLVGTGAVYASTA